MPSTDIFEHHFSGLGLDRQSFVSTYANDFLFEYASGLASRGWAVTLMLPSKDVRVLERHRSGRTDAQIVFAPAPLIPLSLPLYFRKGSYLRWAWSRIATSGKELWREIRAYDVLYVQEYAFGRFEQVCRCAKPNQIIVGAYHGAPLTRFATKRLVIASRRADLILCLTEDELRNVCLQMPAWQSKSSLLGNPVRTEIFKHRGEQRRGLIWCGRVFDHQKRLSTLIQACRRLNPTVWAPLSIVGDGPDLRRIQELVDVLGLSPWVEFCGFISDRAALAARYSRSSVAAFPSAYEGLPLVALEAQSCGLPVVATDISAFRATCFEGARFLVRPGDTPGLAGAIAEAFRRVSHDGEAIRTAVREFVTTKYSDDQIMARLDEMLRTAMHLRSIPEESRR